MEKCEGSRQIPWAEIIKKARVKKVSSKTAKRELAEAGFPVASRPNRQKSHRSIEHIQERCEVSRRWRFLPWRYFIKDIDLISDSPSPPARPHGEDRKP